MIVGKETTLHRHLAYAPAPEAATWGFFPSRPRTHIHTIQARTAMVVGRYAPGSSCLCPGPGVRATSSSSLRRAHPPRASSVASGVQVPAGAPSVQVPLPGARPFSAMVGGKRVVMRLSRTPTISSRAKSAPLQGPRLTGVGGLGHYSWITLDFYKDSKKSIYDHYGGLKPALCGSK